MAKMLEARIAALEESVPDGPCVLCELAARIEDRPPPATCSCPRIQYEYLVLAVEEERSRRLGAER
jgi:hypothetical protein